MDWSWLWPSVVAVLRVALIALLGALGDGALSGGKVAAVAARAVGGP